MSLLFVLDGSSRSQQRHSNYLHDFNSRTVLSSSLIVAHPIVKCRSGPSKRHRRHMLNYPWFQSLSSRHFVSICHRNHCIWCFLPYSPCFVLNYGHATVREIEISLLSFLLLWATNLFLASFYDTFQDIQKFSIGIGISQKHLYPFTERWSHHLIGRFSFIASFCLIITLFAVYYQLVSSQ